MIKENYLLTLYKEHRKKPFLIFRLTMCGGCIEIEKKLYSYIEKDLDLIANINTYRQTRGRYIQSHPFRNKMVLSVCNTINALDRAHLDAMSRGYGRKRFYETNENQDNFLKFIIMYVWDNLEYDFRNREEKINYFKSLITNKLALDAIESMDKKYKEDPLNKDELERRYYKA